MICVTIGRGRHSSLLKEWKDAADAGAELVELRIDCLRRDPDLKRILKDRLTPVVFTIRRGPDGGMWRGEEEKRQKLLREAIVMGVEYVDLEADTAIEIRTALLRDGTAYVQAGAGVVADSDPVAEDTECRNKAAAVLRALHAAEGLSSGAVADRDGALRAEAPPEGGTPR